jgi:hypothetical protein
VLALKLIGGVVLVTAIGLAAGARPPGRPAGRGEVGGLLAGACALYAAGIAAALAGRVALGMAACAVGVLPCALAVWLSRGRTGPDDGRGGNPWARQPPPDPDGEPLLPWDSFERDFRRYADQRTEQTERRSAPR